MTFLPTIPSEKGILTLNLPQIDFDDSFFEEMIFFIADQFVFLLRSGRDEY